jgi:hypothetical protein
MRKIAKRRVANIGNDLHLLHPPQHHRHHQVRLRPMRAARVKVENRREEKCFGKHPK